MSSSSSISSPWNMLYKIGGTAALVAGLVFRRNIAAEISLFSLIPMPTTASDWFMLLQNHRLLGLAYLNVFDLLDYALVGLMFLALGAVLWQTNRSVAAIATVSALAGMAVCFSSNTAFSVLALSEQYAAATTDAQRLALLAAGQALLAFSETGVSTGIYISMFLLAIASLIVSFVMLRSDLFNRATAYVGLLASTLDLLYCITFPFLLATYRTSLALATIPLAGLLWMIWHILVGLRLFQMGREI